MRVSFDGEHFRASYVTGPTHNYLRLALESEATNRSWILEERTHSDEKRTLSSAEVREWITEGVRRANAELGTNYGIKRAEYVISDSVAPAIYVHIAKAIVSAAHRASRLVFDICAKASLQPGKPMSAEAFLEHAKEAGHSSGDAVDVLEYCRSEGWIEAGPGGACF